MLIKISELITQLIVLDVCTYVLCWSNSFVMSRIVVQVTWHSTQFDDFGTRVSTAIVVIIILTIFIYIIISNFMRWGDLTQTPNELNTLISNSNSKLLAPTDYDVNVMGDAVGRVQAEIKKNYKYQYFIHCYYNSIQLCKRQQTKTSTLIFF